MTEKTQIGNQMQQITRYLGLKRRPYAAGKTSALSTIRDLDYAKAPTQLTSSRRFFQAAAAGAYSAYRAVDV